MNPEDLMQVLLGASAPPRRDRTVFGFANTKVDDDDHEFIKLIGEMGGLQCGNTYVHSGSFMSGLKSNELTNGEMLCLFNFNLMGIVRIPHKAAVEIDNSIDQTKMAREVLKAGKEYDEVLRAIMEKNQQGETND